jgi:hypothetical protein
MSKMRWAVGLVVVFALGCAAPVKRQAYNAEANSQIRDVVIAQMQNQESFEAVIIGHPGESFGLIGGLLVAAETQYKSNRLTAAVDAAQTKLQERFSQMLQDGLINLGYSARVLIVPKDVGEDQVVAFVRKTEKADAVLVAAITGGYWAAGPTSDYQPRLMAQVQAVKLEGGATLYEDTFTYGISYGTPDTVHIAADAKYRFSDIDAMVADPARVREGWVEGLRLITAQVLKDVKPR